MLLLKGKEWTASTRAEGTVKYVHERARRERVCRSDSKVGGFCGMVRQEKGADMGGPGQSWTNINLSIQIINRAK